MVKASAVMQRPKVSATCCTHAGPPGSVGAVATPVADPTQTKTKSSMAMNSAKAARMSTPAWAAGAAAFSGTRDPVSIGEGEVYNSTEEAETVRRR